MGPFNITNHIYLITSKGNPSTEFWDEGFINQFFHVEMKPCISESNQKEIKRILLDGWLGSNADEGRDKLRNDPASRT